MPVPNQSLFAEFAPVTKAEWLAKIEKDLKGRPLSDLNWHLNTPSQAELVVAPFLNADDFEEKPEPILDFPRIKHMRHAVPCQAGEIFRLQEGLIADLHPVPPGGGQLAEKLIESRNEIPAARKIRRIKPSFYCTKSRIQILVYG